jgi:hypothetical protein
VLRVLDDAVAVLVESHQSARRDMIRHEEALRREFVDDLLRGEPTSRGCRTGRTLPAAVALPFPGKVLLGSPRPNPTSLDRGRASHQPHDTKRSRCTAAGDQSGLASRKDAPPGRQNRGGLKEGPRSSGCY